ncbi:MAG: isoaspartyl peptidase/L-asparaginase [Thaumarchaeota archaeon]|nr:isoaspartyl peptidase/L-asparaginase [Nitrososphaerota archaeon]
MPFKKTIIVHGGAWNIPDQLIELSKTGVAEAAQIGMNTLTRGGSALDAVEAAIRSMEDKVYFNAGKGASRNSEGGYELDAMIMNGATLQTGCVAAVRNIFHPITLARKIMEQTDHILIVGEGANKLAEKLGITEQNINNLLTQQEAQLHTQLNKTTPPTVKELFAGDTVGAVALDTNGNIAAGTSTGGLPGKLPGRVGDTPLPGCGAYADNQSGGASATGWGEAIAKVVLSKQACDLMANNTPPQKAAETAINTLTQKTKGWAGLITLNQKSETGTAYNTSRMARALMKEQMHQPQTTI